jgi:hypothetical protein
VEAVALLVWHGASVNGGGGVAGLTPLHTAAAFCQAEVAEWLLAQGADPTADSSGGCVAAGMVGGMPTWASGALRCSDPGALGEEAEEDGGGGGSELAARALRLQGVLSRAGAWRRRRAAVVGGA